MAHIHAALMRKYADDAAEHEEPWLLWEFQSTSDGKWLQAGDHPAWYVTTKYRRKPRTIRIGEFDVPEPARTMFDVSGGFFIADPVRGSRNSLHFVGTASDPNLLETGLVHTTKRAARLHAIALCSLTCTPERLVELRKMAAELDKQD